jgi:Fe2+ or Zn2+ uptake regulation protein
VRRSRHGAARDFGDFDTDYQSTTIGDIIVAVKSVEELTALFRRCGRKVTAQRQCIFRVLQGDLSHPTAESVYEAARAEMETISLKTVYQTLNELAAMEEVAMLDLGTGTSRFDPNLETVHHHLVCRSCGKVRDLYADFSNVTVPAGSDEGFEVGRAEVVFRGLCGDCRLRDSGPLGPLAHGAARRRARQPHRRTQQEIQQYQG